MTKWRFPNNNFGAITGIGEAGIETFNGSPYISLTREICQNSMDARFDTKKPVIVEFSSFEIPKDTIPDYKNLYSAMSSCLDFWTQNANKKTIKFFNNALSIMKQRKISVLRISDFNTTGLTGSDKEYNTPWQNLVKASGVSDKGSSAGGSYGIGKSAQFACSELRTLFYTTLDINGLKASQGIARLVSFRQKNKLFSSDNITSGMGYYSDSDKNAAIRECLSLQNKYERSEPGTDIYVLGFKKILTWKDEVIIAVLEDFLMAVYNGDLIVKVDNIEISNKTLGTMIERYKERTPKAVNYYRVLTDNNSILINHTFSNLGTIELRVLIQSGLHRCVMMSRKNGMKIFDQNRISGSIQFAGICVLKDEKINAYFREMENPQHNKWEPYRHSTDTEAKAKRNKSMLSKFIKDFVIEQGKKTTVDEVDAEGVGEFIADIDYADTNAQQKAETVSDQTKDIDISISVPASSQKGFETTLSGKYKNDETKTGDEKNLLYGDTGSKDFGNNHHHMSSGAGFGGGNGDNDGTNGTGKNPYKAGTYNADSDIPVKTTEEIRMMAVRLFISNKDKNEYTLIFIPTRDFEKGYLQLYFDGEKDTRSDKRIPLPISQAVDKVTQTLLVCRNNKIEISNLSNKVKKKIAFIVDYKEDCAVEVNLYGYSS